MRHAVGFFERRINMLNFLKKEANLKYTENGALTHATSESFCLDLFFGAGAMRGTEEKEIGRAVIRAYAEDPVKTLKIVFFARDVRGGLGERRFFRTAVKTLAYIAPEAVNRNIPLFAEYGRFDDLLVLLHTNCEKTAIEEISKILYADIEAMKNGEKVSLIAKWLPSVNTSSNTARMQGKYLCKKLGMAEKEYRKTLSALRAYCDIIENRLRVKDYTFDYEKQTSGALFKYRAAFWRNDSERYSDYLDAAQKGEAKMNTSSLYPYDIVRACLTNADESERKTLDAAWKNLLAFGEGGNSLAVIDGSGSMTWGLNSTVRPIDAALSLGIYFAEHNKGRFANHFITFSETPQLVEIKGRDIYEKTRYCASFNEVANTNLEAVFLLILKTAVKNRVKQSEMPERLYIISDMEFDCCVIGGNNDTLFDTMQKAYKKHGYSLPKIIFWNVSARQSNLPVTRSQTGAALVSGFSPALFDMVSGGDISPEKVMNDILSSDRYAAVG